MNPTQPAEGARQGLRERKKARTRFAIQQEALRLFREQGYGATTVEQIAEAAEVSPSTFFRYFQTKDALVLTDDYDPIMVERFRAQPPGSARWRPSEPPSGKPSPTCRRTSWTPPRNATP